MQSTITPEPQQPETTENAVSAPLESSKPRGASGDRLSLRVAYLVNQYPQTNISFVRREIHAVERLGVPVARYTIRRWHGELVDADDVADRSKTKVVLEGSMVGLAMDALRVGLTRPFKMARALAKAFRLGWGSDGGVVRHLVYLVEACRIALWCRRDHIDWVHAHFGTNPTSVAMLVRAVGGPPYSFTAHGPEEFDRAGPLKLADKIKHAEFVVGISNYTRSQLYRHTPIESWGKIHEVHCVVDPKFLENRSPLIESDGPPRFVAVGRLHEQKGLPLLVEAAHRLAAEGRDFHVHIVGDGPLRQELEQLIERLGLQERVRLLGWRGGDDVLQEMLKCRAFVLPSFAEGLPVVIMEALALGRPVISTNIAGIRELVEPGKSGWLAPAGSVNRLVDAMREALDATPEELASMGDRGADAVAKRHRGETEAVALMGLIERYAKYAGLRSAKRSRKFSGLRTTNPQPARPS